MKIELTEEQIEQLLLDIAIKKEREEAADDIVKQVIDEHPEAFQEFKEGQGKIQGFFVGQIVKISGNNATPVEAAEALWRAIGKKYISYEEKELDNCPFCKAEPPSWGAEVVSTTDWVVECLACNACGPSMESKLDAERAWGIK